MEIILKKRRKSLIEAEILSSEVVVIDKLLNRSVEMNGVYTELCAILTDSQMEFFWDAVLGAATFWNPDSSRKLRDDQKLLIDLNQEIAERAHQLAQLMQQRYEISESTGLSSYDDYHVIHWLDRAAESNNHYQSYIKKDLKLLSTRFDLKYWPRTVEVVEAIAAFADEAEVQVNDEWTEELLSSQKCSTADYLRVLLKAIEGIKEYGPETHVLPKDFRITDKSMATIINCSLDLDSDAMHTSEYVKRARQNFRERKKLKLNS